ncbi:MAG: integrase core domain-containing protein [Methyloceanibacter sp.]
MHKAAKGIRDKPIAPGSPWQNGFVERPIGSIRRECVDHVIALGEAHLRRTLQAYARYYNEKIRPSRVRFSEPDASCYIHSTAATITTKSEFKFSVHTAKSRDRQ